MEAQVLQFVQPLAGPLWGWIQPVWPLVWTMLLGLDLAEDGEARRDARRTRERAFLAISIDDLASARDERVGLAACEESLPVVLGIDVLEDRVHLEADLDRRKGERIGLVVHLPHAEAVLAEVAQGAAAQRPKRGGAEPA